MTTKKTTTEVGGAVRFENPLMPDERLRQMYTAMVQMRMVEERLRSRAAKAKLEVETVRGQEAARASTALSLAAGDVVSDCLEGAPAMELLLGASLDGVLGRREATKVAADRGGVLRLPVAEDGEERLELSLGVGAALKLQSAEAQGSGRVVLVYVGAGEVKAKHWRRVMEVAGERELPVIYVVLPGGENRGKAGELSRRSQSWGVPGFPVDGADAIGLYRVMQESLLRARGGGGAALLECIDFQVKGADAAEAEDPIARLEQLMLGKGAADAAWVKEVRREFRRRLTGQARARRAG